MGRKAKELSNEVKEMVWKMLEDGKTITYVSETFGIPRSTISSLKKRVERRGSIENIPRRGRKSTLSETGKACKNPQKREFERYYGPI